MFRSHHLVIGLCALIGCASVPKGGTGEPLPDSTALVPLADGQPSLTSLTEGKVVVVDFWASWCEPCKEGAPQLNRLAEAYAKTGLVVIGINVGEDAERAQSFVDEAKLSYPIFLDPDFAFADQVGARAVPALLFIDKNGKIQHRDTKLTSDNLARIRELLSGS